MTLDGVYREAIRRLLAGDELDEELAGGVAEALLDEGLGAARGAALLTGLSRRPPAVAELVGMARALRARCVRVPFGGPVFDTCGTGGSGLSTANTSTAVAFVLAAAGVHVAKHGNRASSGRCGSSDLLEELGIPVAVGPDAAARLLERTGLAFLFAPAYHPALAAIAPVRRALGFRTVFNLLGPLCNPAGARRQLLGLADAGALAVVAEALGRLGADDALVVCGDDGLDEVSLVTGTAGLRVGAAAGPVAFRTSPEALGLEPATSAAIAGGGPAENAAIFERVLGGDEGPHGRLAWINAGVALTVAGTATDPAAGVNLARELLRSGAVRQTFDRYREESRALAAAA